MDVWNAATFDSDLVRDLGAHADLIRLYWKENRRLYLEREASDHTGVMPENPHAWSFQGFVESLMPKMEERTIRAWHYTRLVNSEIEGIRARGVYPSTLRTVRDRLDRMVETGELTGEFADQLFDASPFHDDHYGSRRDKFWMTSDPVPTDDNGVKPLLGMWGGESISFTHFEKAIGEQLQHIGLAHVLEIAAPLRATRHSYSAAKAVVAAYARTLDVRPDWSAFDLYVTTPLGPEHILATHSEASRQFQLLANGYPTGFVDWHADVEE